MKFVKRTVTLFLILFTIVWPLTASSISQEKGHFTISQSLDMSHLSSKPLALPAMQDSVLSPSHHFVLHFDRTGEHAVPNADLNNNQIPDFIDSAAIILDYVWQIEIDSLNFKPPLNFEKNPSRPYPVYFQNLGNIYGQTLPLKSYQLSPTSFQFSSYLILENDYQESIFYKKGLEGLKSTAAHEFNHACQLAYAVWYEGNEPLDTFLMEMTSTWIENLVFPNNNYFQYLPSLFEKFSNLSLTSTKRTDAYGNGLFLQMLAKEYGPLIISELWQLITIQPGIQALQSLFTDLNTSLEAKLNQYAIWMFHTGSRTLGKEFFADAAVMPEVKIPDQDKITFTDSLSLQLSVAPFATRFLEIEVSSNVSSLQTISQGLTTKTLLAIITSPGNFNVYRFQQKSYLNPFATKKFFVLLTNANNDTIALKYLIEPAILNEDDQIIVYPNPVNTMEVNQVTFLNLPPSFQLTIFTPDGLVINHWRVSGSSGKFKWNLQSLSGEKIGSGIYLYQLKTPQIKKEGKIAIVN